LCVDTGDTWYISNKAITINGTSAPIAGTLTKQSERVIEVKDGDGEYYLSASRIANARFSGTLAGILENTPAARATFANLAGMALVIRNVYNTAQELVSQTDAEGNFTVEGAIPGDTYTITPVMPEGGTPAPSVAITPQADGDDIGVITLGMNFKALVTPATAMMSELYINESYAFNLGFENIGTGSHLAPAYRLMPPAGVTVTGQTEGTITAGDAVEPGRSKSVLINITCSSVSGDYEYKKIGVEMTNETGDVWEDSFSVRFYRERVIFNLRASEAVSGSITTPDSSVYSFANTVRETVSLPRLTIGEYTVVVSGMGEAVYSLGVGVEADSDFGSFSDTNRYEPNDMEEGAYVITEEKIMAALSLRGEW
jgi:hypothetical protein